jgi:hypothetical protein
LDIQKRILRFITYANWIFFGAAFLVGLLVFQRDFALGVLAGGLIVTINFHLLARTLKKSLTPQHLVSHNVIIAKYYVRFIASGVIIFFLISGHYVDPRGLFVGLSVVVASIVVATVRELKNLIFKEAF